MLMNLLASFLKSELNGICLYLSARLNRLCIVQCVLKIKVASPDMSFLNITECHHLTTIL